MDMWSCIIIGMQVTFVLLDEGSVEQLRDLDPDKDWRQFQDGDRMWMLQAYLRLRTAGCPVALSADLPAKGIAVVSGMQRRVLRRRLPRGCPTILVSVRQDLGEAHIADFEVVQNRHQSDGRRQFFVPHWPQPGLIPRDPARGARIETVAFKGFSGNLGSEFHDGEWRRFLGTRGLRWVADAVPFARQTMNMSALMWNDYREVDLVLAVRPSGRAPYPRKPATKLYNAWHAGVPALLGPEIAYRELRQSQLDYLEVGNREQAQRAVELLRDQPSLYLAMVENGHQRAREFNVECIVQQWRRLLYETIPSLANAPHVLRWRGKPLWRKEIARRLSRVIGLQR